ncbi:hypothetical protein BB558_004092 [Smittium angustum]|uniref:C3H1-type domain-containing protein n=1 Tax=Smittium angustum TaxID=133377 RepID=A0A2U1J4A5_SMIAN|nr:hypothetical protein BB558_004092 [Smittium angustum]
MTHMTENSLASLQITIHRKLVEVNYAQEDDTVFAEYVTTMIRNEKDAAQINKELLELLGDAYNPEFGFWVEAESKNPIYYHQEIAQSVSQETEMNIDEPIQHQQTVPRIDHNTHEKHNSMDNHETRKTLDNERSNRSRDRNRDKSDSRNKLFTDAIKKSEEDNRRTRGTSREDRHSSNRSSNYSKKLQEISIKHRSGSTSDSRKLNADLLSRLGKASKAIGKIEKKSPAGTSPTMATIKGIAKSSGVSPKKQSIFSRLGARDESISKKQKSPENNSSLMTQGIPNMNGQYMPLQLLDQNGQPMNNQYGNFDDNNPYNSGVLQGTKRIRCTKWPMCDKGNSCSYFHPTKICLKFPNCPYSSNECMFIHPHVQGKQLASTMGQSNTASPNFSVLCKYGVGCLNPTCHFTHPPGRSLDITDGLKSIPSANQTKIPILCKFYPGCLNPVCSYIHDPSLVSTATPTTINVGAGDSAMVDDNKGPIMESTNGEISASNTVSGSQLPGSQCDPSKKVPIPCRNGASCTRLDCHFMHPHEQNVSSVPCKFGFYCTRPNCAYLHPTRNMTLLVNNKGTNDPANRLDHISDRPFASAESASLVTGDGSNTTFASQNQPLPSLSDGSNIQVIPTQFQANNQFVVDASLVSQKSGRENEQADDVVMSL